jgi:hypothetical protein
VISADLATTVPVNDDPAGPDPLHVA